MIIHYIYTGTRAKSAKHRMIHYYIYTDHVLPMYEKKYKHHDSGSGSKAAYYSLNHAYKIFKAARIITGSIVQKDVYCEMYVRLY